MALERAIGERRLVLAMNPGSEPVTLGLTVDGVDHGSIEAVDLGDGARAVAPDGSAATIRDGRTSLALAPRSALLTRVIAH
jgi:hypothetical protein